MNCGRCRGGAMLALLLCLGGAAGPAVATAQAATLEGEFIYYTQARDTLIGLSRRLLQQPQRWHDLQVRNHVAAARRMPIGTAIRIPYSWLRMTAETASVAGVSGSVVQAGSSLATGEVLSQGSVIETGADGSVTLDLADGSVITLQKSSALRLDEMQRVSGASAAHDIRLKLRSGRVETVVKPHGDVGRFEIVTPVAVSAVRGTRFRTSFSDDSARATTETLQGSVAVAGAATVSVPAGFGTLVDRDAPPLQPVALLPPPDLSALPTRYSLPLLNVSWPAVAGARAYRVQVATDPDFHTIARDLQSPRPSVGIPAPPDGNYWLRARSIDQFGLEGPDAVRTFVQHLLPAAPVPIDPKPAARVTGTQVTFQWTAVGADARYRLQVARDALFADLILEREVSVTTHATVDGLAPGMYFWRVATRNPQGESGAWSEVQSYRQRASAPTPEPPTLQDHQLLLAWEAQTGQTYRVQLARDADFKYVVVDQTLAVPRLSMRAPYPAIYYARIQSVDPDGTAGSFGPSRRFEVPPPRWVRILLPLVMLLPLLQ